MKLDIVKVKVILNKMGGVAADGLEGERDFLNVMRSMSMDESEVELFADTCSTLFSDDFEDYDFGVDVPGALDGEYDFGVDHSQLLKEKRDYFH